MSQTTDKAGRRALRQVIMHRLHRLHPHPQGEIMLFAGLPLAQSQADEYRTELAALVSYGLIENLDEVEPVYRLSAEGLAQITRDVTRLDPRIWGVE